MKKLLLLLSASLCVSAYAADNMATSTPQAEFGANDSGAYNVGSYADAQFGAANSSALNSGVNAAGAMRLDAGYKVNSYMGFEAGFTGLTTPSAGDQQAQGQYLDVSIKGYLPISSYFDLHGQVGMAYVSVDNTSSYMTNGGGINELVGVGADIYVTKSIAITANDYYYISNLGQSHGLGNTNVVMGGLKYDFR